MQNLCVIGEMTEERQRKFGQKLVDTVIKFCTAHNISMDCTTASTVRYLHGLVFIMECVYSTGKLPQILRREDIESHLYRAVFMRKWTT